MNKKLIRRWDS